MNRQTKQVIVIRRDLKMRRGKEIAQGGHAVLAFLTKNLNLNLEDKPQCLYLSGVVKNWLANSFRKITLIVNSEEELLDIHNKALAAGLESNLITDNGTTEFNNVKTNTCIAIGPDYDEKIDIITGHLKLY